MSTPVKLYVYDLSNGMAKQLSLQLTGRQIDGVWHTSVVVFGKEIFYGQGINMTAPGQSHHGAPLQIVDMGETAIDEETFTEYLTAMRDHYTADKYHLLDFNCNSFTNDCIGFLTGGSIPPFIKDLPSDFLSTPFGQALRPTIDNMFRPGRAPVVPPQAVQQAAQASPNPALASSLLQSVAAMATQSGSAPAPAAGTPASSTVSAPMQICSNAASFATLLRGHRVLVAFFTSTTCPPCRIVEPVFERLAEEKTAGRAGRDMPAFVKINIDAGSSSQLAGQYGVRATPTFLFFLDGNKTNELKGANAPELRTQVDMLLYQAFPPHPHTRLSLPAVEALSMDPILFTQVPPLSTVLAKFLLSIDEAAASAPAGFDKEQFARVLSGSAVPYLQGLAKARSGEAQTISPPATPTMLGTWAQVTHALAATVSPEKLFPLVDMWRLAVLDPAVPTWLAALPADTPAHPVHTLLGVGARVASAGAPGARNTVLTALRLLANALGAPALARALCGAEDARTRVMELLVPSLLHADAQVGTAAASAAFNVAAALQRRRVERVRAGRSDAVRDEFDGEWEVELLSAVVEAIQREGASEDVVHRLTASLAFLLRLSPVYEEELSPLLEVLQAKDTMKAKMGEEYVKTPNVRKLLGEVADKLCP